MDNRADIEIRGWVDKAKRIVVFSGAGMSAESGVPTFRDAQSGLWANFKPEELATEEAFRANPSQVWEWYAWRRKLVSKVDPNRGHQAIADFQKRHPGRLSVVTQNVDGLHAKAGSTDIYHLHGQLFEDRWLDPCGKSLSGNSPCPTETAEAASPPACSHCNNLVRPGVVWFGEGLPAQEWEGAKQAILSCDLILVVGTSGQVWPAAGLVQSARAAKARVVVLNPSVSELDHLAHRVVRGTAAEQLPLWLGEDSAAIP